MIWFSNLSFVNNVEWNLDPILELEELYLMGTSQAAVLSAEFWKSMDRLLSRGTTYIEK